MTILKYSICDKTQKLKLIQNSKTQIVTELENSICDKTQKLKWWQNSKINIVTKLKNSNYDNSKTQIVTKLKNQNSYNSETQIVTKLNFFNLWQNSKLKLWQNSNCDKNWWDFSGQLFAISRCFWVVSIPQILEYFLSLQFLFEIFFPHKS